MLTETEKKQLTRFENDLALPKWKYVLRYAITWGLLVGFSYSVIIVLFRDKTFNEMIKRELWINLVGFIIGGFFYSLWMRGFTRRQARKLREKDSQPG